MIFKADSYFWMYLFPVTSLRHSRVLYFRWQALTLCEKLSEMSQVGYTEIKKKNVKITPIRKVTSESVGTDAELMHAESFGLLFVKK